SGLLAFLDADPHGLRRHRLPVTELAVDHRKRWRIDDDLGRLVWNDGTHLLPANVDRHTNDAVAVVPGEIGGREVCRDALGFVSRGLGVRKYLGNEIDEVGNLYGDHR